MKKALSAFILAAVLSTFFSLNVFANTLTWESVPGNHGGSVLLDENIAVSTDSFETVARGEILDQGSTGIGNKGDGRIYINITTLAHRNVDKIFHTVFLDQWDDDREDWVQIDYFEFEETKADNPNLSSLITSFYVSGYPTKKYYRVRGLHAVELGDTLEGCATETDGVYITKN